MKSATATARHEDIMFMYDMGEYIPRIAERVGMTVQSVRTIIYREERERGFEREEVSRRIAAAGAGHSS